MSQLDWMAKWNTVHRPGYKFTKFRAQLLDERVLASRDIHVLLYPLFPKASCVVFENQMTGRMRACYDKKLVKAAIKFGYPVRIEKNVTKPRPIEHHYDH
jgi:hypothetical protein